MSQKAGSRDRKPAENQNRGFHIQAFESRQQRSPQTGLVLRSWQRRKAKPRRDSTMTVTQRHKEVAGEHLRAAAAGRLCGHRGAHASTSTHVCMVLGCSRMRWLIAKPRARGRGLASPAGGFVTHSMLQRRESQKAA